MSPHARPISERLCSLQAAGARLDPIGTASVALRLLAVELATPWTEDIYRADPEGTFPQRASAIQSAAYERMVERGGGFEVFQDGYPALVGIAPDAEWTDAAARRALLFTRPDDGAFAGYEVAEYLFASDDRVVELVRAFYDEEPDYRPFEDARVPHGGQREFLVCTHGQVDICCARFGVPLYRQARDAPGVRTWRTTHFGGHRYAPTAWDLPSGYMWGFLDQAASARVLRRDGEAAALHGNVRGWTGVKVQGQVVDRVGLERFGWDWLSYRRSAEVAEESEGRWRVRLAYESPSSVRGALDAVVRVARTVADPGCGPAWGEHVQDVPEYEIESLTER